MDADAAPSAAADALASRQAEMRRAIMAIQADTTIDEAEKGRRRQAVMMGSSTAGGGGAAGGGAVVREEGALSMRACKPPHASVVPHSPSLHCAHTHTRTPTHAGPSSKATAAAAAAAEEEQRAGDTTFLDDNLKCAICMNLCERPVTVSMHACRLWGSAGVGAARAGRLHARQ